MMPCDQGGHQTWLMTFSFGEYFENGKYSFKKWGKLPSLKQCAQYPPTHKPCLGVLTLIKIDIYYFKYFPKLLNTILQCLSVNTI